ncbi:MAG: deoxynucleoside kinase [Bacteroidia bacterium]|nr:deoxynucleoside kinase [Bacteroidia bacterium]
MNKYICIEGIIGSGKTTLTHQIYSHLKNKGHTVFSVFEQFQTNKLLELFYLHPKKYNTITEYSFLIDRFNQLYEHFQKNDNGITISDYTFRKCLWFAENNLDILQFKEYQKYYMELEKELNKEPDLIIFLDVKPLQAFQNIQIRSRKMESNIQIHYLESLYSTYRKHIHQSPVPVKEIILDNYENTFDYTLDILKEFLNLDV